METSNYQQAKAELKEIAKYCKLAYKGDLPAIRMGINDSCDNICKTGNLTGYQQNLLHNYACTLHPKN